MKTIAFGAPPTTPFGQQVQQQPQQQQQGFGGFGGAQSTPAFGSTLFGTPQAAPAPASGFSFGGESIFTTCPDRCRSQSRDGIRRQNVILKFTD